MTVDSGGKPTRLRITGGEKSDFEQAIELLDGQKPLAVLADKGYDAKYIVEKIEAIDAIAVIPSRKTNRVQRIYDKELYKQRNVVERFFNKLKHFRRIATGYDKLAVVFGSFVLVACIYLWIK